MLRSYIRHLQFHVSVFSLPRRIIITIDITVVAVSSFVSRVRVKVSVIYGDYNTLNFSSGKLKPTV